MGMVISRPSADYVAPVKNKATLHFVCIHGPWGLWATFEGAHQDCAAAAAEDQFQRGRKEKLLDLKQSRKTGDAHTAASVEVLKCCRTYNKSKTKDLSSNC